MKILVTGANGFIGRRLASRLSGRGHEVVRFLQDLTKPFSLNDYFDLVVHLAAHNITHVGEVDACVYEAVNVEGTRHLLQAVKSDRLIYLSTSKVYQNEGKPLTEESPLGPQGLYEQSKLKAEGVCRSSFGQEGLVILRSVNVMGWGQAPKAVLPVFFQKAMLNQPLDIIYAADTPVQFIYVEDLADAVEAVIAQDKVTGVFNIAYEKLITLEQMARTIIARTHSLSALNIAPGVSKPVFAPVVCEKARQQLGWQAKTGFGEILDCYAKEYRM